MWLWSNINAMRIAWETFHQSTLKEIDNQCRTQRSLVYGMHITTRSPSKHIHKNKTKKWNWFGLGLSSQSSFFRVKFTTFCRILSKFGHLIFSLAFWAVIVFVKDFFLPPISFCGILPCSCQEPRGINERNSIVCRVFYIYICILSPYQQFRSTHQPKTS